ncbi:response regulator transcription factor [Pseudomonas sp. P9_35]|uniref:response regulator transcription factor n=1 Tax=unclassified Pseudomonas TaxID=196821 RepID=UPI002A36A0D6|nr:MULTISPECIES: response regulator transcription factor [unclassified Pseudomonas]WPN65637.1 response regulator transcription factor [Pseudomonas sp. P9_32]WPN71388.1 response regulator transcription factor [Pseudomonas sp. P9_35]
MKTSRFSPLRVALLDDHALIRLAVEARLSREEDMYVAALYKNGGELFESLGGDAIDFLILDFWLSNNDVDGLRLMRSIRDRYPDLPILVSSSEENQAMIQLMRRCGVNGFCGKSQEIDDLVRAIRVIAAGRSYFPQLGAEGQEPRAMADMVCLAGDSNQSICMSALLNNPALSAREQEVLRCFLEGVSVSQMAVRFSRSHKTISAQKQAGLRKLGISSDQELFKMCRI